MNYIENQKALFETLPIPNWKRVKLPNDVFDLSEKEESNVLINSENVDIIKLDEALYKISEDENILDNLNIDKDSSKSLGDKFSSFINSSSKNSYLISPSKNNTLSKISLNYDIEDNGFVKDHYLVIVPSGKSLELNINYLNNKSFNAKHYGSLKLIAKEGSNVVVNKVQILSESSENFDQSFIVVEEGAKAIINDIQIGSKFKALAVEAKLMGRRSECELNSIYFGEDSSLTDISYTMNHFGKKSDSKILSKGALKKNSNKVFRGNLVFEKDSTGSVGKEEEFVMLLDEKIKSDSIPALMCSEDDVIGEHAASVGQIDNNKMFYLMSRGLSEIEAKKLIVKASFEEIFSKLTNEDIKLIVNAEIESRIS